MDAIPTREEMLSAVMKSKCENIRRLDLVHMDRMEMYSKLLAVKCPCLQELMRQRLHTKSRQSGNNISH
jgi:hypothetical protein